MGLSQGEEVHVHMKGDFSDDWKTTRGYLAADGRDMTDVWVLTIWAASWCSSCTRATTRMTRKAGDAVGVW